MFFVFFFFFNKLSRECCPSNEPRHLSSCKHATEISSVQRGARQGKIVVGEVCILSGNQHRSSLFIHQERGNVFYHSGLC